jgi:hypothetical protein
MRFEHGNLGAFFRVAQNEAHQEAIKLRLRKRIRSLEIDGVLSR